MTTLVAAAREALRGAMEVDDSVVVLGEDVVAGGPFGLTRDLADAYGLNRVRNTPISEGAVMGATVGLALGGKRPVVDLMFNDFVTLAADQLFNHAAKIHFMSGGRYTVPLVVWTIGGAGTRWGAHHSQRLDGWLTQVPGLKVLAPATPRAAARAVEVAIADPDPVVVFADRALLYATEELDVEVGTPWQPRQVAEGDELTVVATGRLVHAALAARELADVSAAVLDLQCLAPLPAAAIVEAVTKTSRVLILHDEAGGAGVAAQVAAIVAEHAFWALDVPVRRLTSPPTPIPAGPELEDAHMLEVAQIARAMREVVEQ